MASCVRNICAKNYSILIIDFQVTVENVGDTLIETQCISWILMCIDAINRWIKQREDTGALIRLVRNLNRVKAKIEAVGRVEVRRVKNWGHRPKIQPQAKIEAAGRVEAQRAKNRGCRPIYGKDQACAKIKRCSAIMLIA